MCSIQTMMILMTRSDRSLFPEPSPAIGTLSSFPIASSAGFRSVLKPKPSSFKTRLILWWKPYTIPTTSALKKKLRPRLSAWQSNLRTWPLNLPKLPIRLCTLKIWASTRCTSMKPITSRTCILLPRWAGLKGFQIVSPTVPGICTRKSAAYRIEITKLAWYSPPARRSPIPSLKCTPWCGTCKSLCWKRKVCSISMPGPRLSAKPLKVLSRLLPAYIAWLKGLLNSTMRLNSRICGKVLLIFEWPTKYQKWSRYGLVLWTRTASRSAWLSQWNRIKLYWTIWSFWQTVPITWKTWRRKRIICSEYPVMLVRLHWICTW